MPGKKLYVVGMGPGEERYMTREAIAALEESDVIAGYTVYINLLPEKYRNKEQIVTGMRQEEERCRMSLERASEGKTVALVCSGDAGVYGMASLVLELAEDYPGVEVNVVSGVTAALSGSAVLGSPLSNDFAVISLSDILTPKDKIIRRLRAAAEGDFCIALYNPGSRHRPDALKEAVQVLMESFEGGRVAGIVENIGREDQKMRICTLKELSECEVNMFMTVFIGNSLTKVIDGRLVTPRGYSIRKEEEERQDG